MSDIINIRQYGDALRNTGYKNIESAVSEIIDNAIEAKAKDIFVFVSDTIFEKSGKKQVSEIAFLDNGIGMDIQTLETCLQIGYSTRSERKGIGRFGVGLPQASLHVCPLVEVYSWQGGIDNCRVSFLDINKIRSGDQRIFEEPQPSALPDKYRMYSQVDLFDSNFSFAQSGTLVIWKDCDNVSPIKVKPLFDRLKFTLGQKFRHLIKDGSQNIFLVNLDNEAYNAKIIPNDPLFLMKPNLVLGNLEVPGFVDELTKKEGFTEALFEPYVSAEYPEGKMVVPIRYRDRNTGEAKTANVTLLFSVIKKEFYDKSAISGNPGGTEMGKFVKKLEGISVVRSGREIDFGKFDFYDNLNQPQHRWWGCEISFNPELDEVFGVSNNKQHVELIRHDDAEYDEDEVKPIWLQLRNPVGRTIEAMYRRNESIRNSARTPQVSQAEQIVNKVEADNKTTTSSEENRLITPPDEVKSFIEDRFTIDEVPPSPEIVETKLNNKINFLYKPASRAPFFDYEFKGVAIVTINTDHIFYRNFLSNIENNSELKVSFELFIASLIRTIDEAKEAQREQYDGLVQDWNEKLRKYISEQTGK